LKAQRKSGFKLCIWKKEKYFRNFFRVEKIFGSFHKYQSALLILKGAFAHEY
jgi:hypothetical protein